MAKDLKKTWIKDISKHLVGRKIKKIDYLTQEEKNKLGWHASAVVIELDNNIALYPSQDSEGNGPGAIFTNIDDLPVLPEI